MAGRPAFRLLLEEDRTFGRYLRERYEKTERKKPLTTSERKRIHDKVKQIIRTIEDLTWFAENWPEPQLRLIFTTEGKERMSPFMRLIHAVVEMGSNYDPNKATDEEKERAKRVREVCRELLLLLGRKSPSLAPNALRVLLAGHGDADLSLRLQALRIGY